MSILIHGMEMPTEDEEFIIRVLPDGTVTTEYGLPIHWMKALPVSDDTQYWIPATERLPECEWGAEVGNIEWISRGMVFSGCFGRGGKYRDAYFRTWTGAGEGMDAKDADYWRTVTLPEPSKEEI